MEAFFILTKIRIQNVTYITSKLPNFKTSKLQNFKILQTIFK